MEDRGTASGKCVWLTDQFPDPLDSLNPLNTGYTKETVRTKCYGPMINKGRRFTDLIAPYQFEIFILDSLENSLPSVNW